MNSNSPDEHLGALLRRSHQVTPTRNPHFRASVWARIESGQRSPATWGEWLRSNTFRLASLATVSVLIAGVGGGWLATAETKRTREQLVQRYLASIDPHQKSSTEHR